MSFGLMSDASMFMFDGQLKHIKEGGQGDNEDGEVQVGRRKGSESQSIPITSSAAQSKATYLGTALHASVFSMETLPNLSRLVMARDPVTNPSLIFLAGTNLMPDIFVLILLIWSHRLHLALLG